MGSKIRRRSSAALVGEMPVTPRRPRLDHGPTLRPQGRDVVRRVACLGQVQEQPERLKVRVDATSREVFAYQSQIVPGNRTAVPAP